VKLSINVLAAAPLYSARQPARNEIGTCCGVLTTDSTETPVLSFGHESICTFPAARNARSLQYVRRTSL